MREVIVCPKSSRQNGMKPGRIIWNLIEIGIDPHTAESEACRIEHVISKETFHRLVEANQNAKEERNHHEN